MKKIFFAIIFSAVLSIGYAQSSFTLGMRYGVMHPNNINRTVYSYNYARQWLSQKMGYFGTMYGYEASWQIRTDKVGIELVYSKIKQTNEAHGLEPNSGMMGYRKIKIAMGGLSAGFNMTLIQKKHFEVIPSLDFDLCRITGSTTYSNDATFAGASPEPVIADYKFGNTVAINFTLFATQWIGINIRPYYQLPWSKANVEGLAAYWGGSGTGAQRERVGNYGVSGSLIVMFGRDYY